MSNWGRVVILEKILSLVTSIMFKQKLRIKNDCPSNVNVMLVFDFGFRHHHHLEQCAAKFHLTFSCDINFKFNDVS